jgi:tRNA 2-thiouridine synthesizing protein A
METAQGLDPSRQSIAYHEFWDAGSLACGPMLLVLRGRLERLAPGQVFCLITRDEGAPVDVPAWCRLTGHRLIRAAHPIYHLERRKD